MIHKIALPILQQLDTFRAATDFNKTPAEIKQRECARTIYAQFFTKDDSKKIVPAIVWDTLHVVPVSVPTVVVDGAIICDLSFFIHNYPEVAQRTLFGQTDVHWQHNDLSTLVHAAYNRAVVVYVPAQVHSKKMIDLNQLIEQYVGSLLLEHVFIIVEGGSTLTLFDHVHNTRNVTVRCVAAWVAENAHATLVRDQQVTKKAVDISRNVFYVNKNASLEFFFLTAGSGLIKTTLDLHARAQGAQIKVRGACVLHDSSVGELISYQNHGAAHTVSDVNIKNVVCDSAQTMYRGTIHIDRDAVHTDAVQENKNLLLGSCARAHSIPEIEALNNDVHCAHGSAIGQLDDDSLFYLQTRGLPRHIAQQMLVEAFLCDVFVDVDKRLRKMMQVRILDALLTKKNEALNGF